jgi:hypothetical protein
VDYTLAKTLGAFLSEPVCHCENNCSAYWTRALILDKRNRLVELNTTKTQFHQFLLALLFNFHDEWLST